MTDMSHYQEPEVKSNQAKDASSGKYTKGAARAGQIGLGTGLANQAKEALGGRRQKLEDAEKDALGE